MMPICVRAMLAALLVAALAACKPDVSAPSAPLEIAADTYCSLDGMTLADYPGPKAQIHYAQGAPEFFCDTVEMFSLLLQPEQQRTVRAVYVNDMGSTDWEQPAGHWIDARSGFYVVGSRRRGSMGPTIASFASPAAADAFAGEQGGRVYRFDEITLDMVALDGGVIKDRGM